MNIQIISFHCTLKNKLGTVLSSTFNRDVVTATVNSALPLAALAEGLQDIQKGERRSIEIGASEAYGFYDVSKVVETTIDDLVGAEGLKIGESVVYAPNGKKPSRFRVTSRIGDLITLDANHPLAGQDLVFEVEATEVRNATPEEIDDIEDSEEQSFHH